MLNVFFPLGLAKHNQAFREKVNNFRVIMAIRVVEFSNGRYKIRKMFA
jgi:hypothetical protein